jgi:hypothetical protein
VGIPAVLCDIHRTPMNFVEMTLVVWPRDVWTKNMMACSEAGCTRHYAINRGYIDIREQRIDHGKVARKLCKKHRHEAKAVVALICGKPLWQCLEDECLSGEGGNGASIRVGDIVVANGHSGHCFEVVGVDDLYATLRMVGNQRKSLIAIQPKHTITRIPVSALLPYPLRAAV